VCSGSTRARRTVSATSCSAGPSICPRKIPLQGTPESAPRRGRRGPAARARGPGRARGGPSAPPPPPPGRPTASCPRPCPPTSTYIPGQSPPPRSWSTPAHGVAIGRWMPSRRFHTVSIRASRSSATRAARWASPSPVSARPTRVWTAARGSPARSLAEAPWKASRALRRAARSRTIRACDSQWARVGISSVSSPTYCGPPTALSRSRARSSATTVSTSTGSPRVWTDRKDSHSVACRGSWKSAGFTIPASRGITRSAPSASSNAAASTARSALSSASTSAR
jgi:hypothetical protein